MPRNTATNNQANPLSPLGASPLTTSKSSEPEQGPAPFTHFVSGGLRILLRLEGLCILAASLLAYTKFGNDWRTFALFFFAPDLSFAGYLAGPRAGAILYNLAHSLVGALALLSVGIFLATPMAITASLIWTAHIGFDRALGYGLKYSAGFRLTHLGIIGHQRKKT